MSVNVCIKQKALFKKKLTINQIIKLTNLSYGVCDENYRLIEKEIGNHTLIYDPKKLARGINLTLDKNDVFLSLSLPTSKEEITTFYEVIERICNYLNVKNYLREEKEANLKDKERFIAADIEGSINGLKAIEKGLKENIYDHLEIFGIYNPISIGPKEIKEFATDLDKFSDFINHLQSLDAYYATPKVYKVKDRLVGIYAIGPNIPSVIPTKPYIVLDQIKDISDWYVFSNNNFFRYDDFINHISKKDYYDFNHVIVNLQTEELEELRKKYHVEI